MRRLILADSAGREQGFLKYKKGDFEVSRTENSFEIMIPRFEYEKIPKGSLIYIPDTEYGGIYRRTNTNTEQGYINIGGLTWRGRMQKKIIEPPPGQDYATDAGELNTIVKARVEAAFSGLFVGSTEDTGVTASTFRYDRYCSLEAGLTKLLKTYGYRLELSYSQPLKAVVVTAVPIVDYSQSIELSSDMRNNYTMQSKKDGVNHLICLGKGELKDRVVYHWYADVNGNISTTQTQFGVDEITEIFDNPGAELPDLIQSGRDRLASLMDSDKFDMKTASNRDIGIGDIVGGRDYLSGMIMTSPIAGKIVTLEGDAESIEYKLEDDVTVTAPAALLIAPAQEEQETEQIAEGTEEQPEEEPEAAEEEVAGLPEEELEEET